MSVSEQAAAQLQAKLTVALDSLTKKNREFDHLNLQHAKEEQRLRTLFANYLMRMHIRSHKTKRCLMQLHLTALEMEESMAREQQRAASGEVVVYDERAMVNKATLRKLAHLYRKRPLHITAELDDKFTHDIKGKFFATLNNYQAVVRELDSLFLRNVALTKETLEYKQQAEEDRRERDKAVREAADKSERLDAVTREVEELRRRVGKMERDEEVRRKKEAARAVQARTEQYSKAFRGGVDVDEEKEVGASGDSPTPQSPLTVQPPNGLFLALSPSGGATHTLPSKRMTAGSGGLPALDGSVAPLSPKVAAHPLATPTHAKKSSKRSTASTRQLASINTKNSDSPRAADKLSPSPLSPVTPLSARSGRDDNKQGGSSLPAIASPRNAAR